MNASGIQVSDALQQAYACLAQGSALKVSIVSESLEPAGTVNGADGDQAVFDGLGGLVKDDEAAYFVVKARSGEVVLVSYVSDSAAVRDKMTYASTRQTLARGLKTGYAYFTTSKSELSWQSYARERGLDGSGARQSAATAGGLSKDEEALKGIKADEQDIHNTSSRRAIASSGVGMPIDDDATSALNALATASRTRYVILAIDVAAERVRLDSTGDVESLEDLPAKLSKDAPRYLFLSHAYVDTGDTDDTTAADQEAASGKSKIVFVYLCPETTKVKERMLYSSNRAAVLASAEAAFRVDVKFEGETLDVADLKERIAPAKQNSTQRFTKPRRPGRK
ncbi:hypothetical protein PYCC9005_000496 [Savitreella phatthalungensis]